MTDLLWAPMAPAWARWLPCSVQHLRIVPDVPAFPVEFWNTLPEPLPWDEPVWCDPGGSDEWIARSLDHHGTDEAELAEQHGLADYEQMIAIRSARIELFTAMCGRADIPAPHTLDELLESLLEFGLYSRVDGLYRPQLDRNPLDVLPLTSDEAADEAQMQFAERAGVVGIGIRRLFADGDEPPVIPVERDPNAIHEHPDGSITVTTTVQALAVASGVPAGQVVPALEMLVDDEIITVDTDGDSKLSTKDKVAVTVPGHFAEVFAMEEIPPPEHT